MKLEVTMKLAKAILTELSPTRIEIQYAGCLYYDKIDVETFATGRLKEKITPLMDAVEKMQEVILYLDP